MNLHGEPVRVGDRVQIEERLVRPETVAFYRDTFGDRNGLYDGPDAVAPPLLFHSEVYEHVDRWYLKRLVGNLHARQEWQLFAPLRPGTTVHTRSTVVERYRRRSRDYVVNEVDYADAEGRLLVRGRTHQSFLVEDPGQRDGFVVDRSAAGTKRARSSPQELPGPELEPVALTVDLETCWRFSGPGRNYHTDPGEARKLGFPEVVVQGMLSTCLLSQLMADAFGMGWLCGGRMDVRLTNVLWGGERVRARGKVGEDVPEGDRLRRSVDLWVERDDPKQTVITIGTASALI